jgi:hypothetical protein
MNGLHRVDRSSSIDGLSSRSAVFEEPVVRFLTCSLSLEGLDHPLVRAPARTSGQHDEPLLQLGRQSERCWHRAEILKDDLS